MKLSITIKRSQFILISFFLSVLLTNCGTFYFPFEFDAGKRSIRDQAQSSAKITIIPLTRQTAIKANKSEYKSQIKFSTIRSKQVLVDKNNKVINSYPLDHKPGPYILGRGDVFEITQIFQKTGKDPVIFSRPIIIEDDGFINLIEIGRLKAEGLSKKELENKIKQRMSERFIPQKSFQEKYPKNNDPGPYKIGVGDSLFLITSVPQAGSAVGREVRTRFIVPNNGNIKILNIGTINVLDKSLGAVYDLINNRSKDSLIFQDFNLEINGFNSKKVYFSMGNSTSQIPYSAYPIFISDILEKFSLSTRSLDMRIVIIRGPKEFSFSLKNIVRERPKIRIFPEDKIYAYHLPTDANLELNITDFNSTKFFVNYKPIPYTNRPILFKNLVGESEALNEFAKIDRDLIIRLERNGRKYYFSAVGLFDDDAPPLRVFPDDKIIIQPLDYSGDAVFVIGETAKQSRITIDSVTRPTLSTIIFDGFIDDTMGTDKSQIFVLREKKIGEFDAYHLDMTSPHRAILASSLEMRPQDVVYIGAQPLVNYNRVLGLLLGTAQTTLQGSQTIVQAAQGD